MSFIRNIVSYGRSIADLVRGTVMAELGIRVGTAITQLEERIGDVQRFEKHLAGVIPVDHSVYTTAGTYTYTPPPGTKAIVFETVGGGGGGGGVDQAATFSASGGGGGSGGYARKLVHNPTGPFLLLVGAGGAGGLAGNNAGSIGADTTVTKAGVVIAAARGGAGGGGNVVAAVPHIGGFGGRGGGDPNVSTNIGDFTSVGNPGLFGVCLAAASAFSGNGGGSYFGSGGQPKAAPTGAGVDAPGIGGGGSGGTILSGGADQAGGAGHAGGIVVWEFR